MAEASDVGRMPGRASRAGRVRVWDLFIRLFHLFLIVSAAVAAVTGFLLDSPWIDLHVAAGTAVAALILARIVWGFAGSTHARFSRFVPGPGMLTRHIGELRAGKAHRHLGHNPLGALMVVAVLLVGLGLAATGALVLGGIFKAGPAAFFASYDLGRSAKEVHELLAYGLLGLVALHIAGVVFESRRTGENLARAMVTGDKPAGSSADRPAPATARRRLAASAILLLLAAATAGILALMRLPGLALPVASLDPAYREECGACHIAYNPSLLPRASWHALFASLDDHFGEDASLPDATRQELEAWTAAHAAESADTKPAHVLARVDPAAPYRLTATPFWKRMHGDIPDAVFASAAVKMRGNCAACHADAATGRFYPSQIDIPEEAFQ